MEVTSKPQENENINGSSSSTPPLTPKTNISRSEPNPYPTTFVQADTTSFKQVVQMLTGSSKQPPSSDLQINKSSFIIPPKKQGFKLYERRNSLKNGLMINPFAGSFSPRNKLPDILSPSILDFPSLVLSPITPLTNENQLYNSSSSSSASPLMGMNCSSEEEKAIAEKKFYLHPSPRTSTSKEYSEPELLSLFPVTSPRCSGGTSSSS